MEPFGQVPGWMGPAVLGAVIAAGGYVAKLLLEWIGEVRTRRRIRHAKLVELFSLLWAGKVTFDIQNDNRNWLEESIRKGDSRLESIKGFDKLFTAAYPDMSKDERERHSIIRAYTEHTIRPLNESLLQWLKDDTYFKAQTGRNSRRAKLARRLADLEAHLLLWQAKYAIWMAEPSHALVYLADEEAHGLGFPKGIELDVLEVIRRGSSREWEKEQERKKEIERKKREKSKGTEGRENEPSEAPSER
jgi:hypothetical protein